jgi:hypothetical protein
MSQMNQNLKRLTEQFKAAPDVGMEADASVDAATIDKGANTRANAFVRKLKERGVRVNSDVKKVENKSGDLAKLVGVVGVLKGKLAVYGVDTAFMFESGKFSLSGNTDKIEGFLRKYGFKFDNQSKQWHAPLASIAGDASFGSGLVSALAGSSTENYTKQNADAQKMSGSPIDQFLADYEKHYKAHEKGLQDQ